MIDHWRQMDIVSPKDLSKYPVTVIGAGGIGSFTVQALTKMGVSNLTVYDPDIVELHNIANQGYRTEDIGQTKVEALKTICKQMSGVEIKAIPEKFSRQRVSGIVISGVDSMAARIDIWGGLKYNSTVCFYIDARMGVQVTRVHTVRPWNVTEFAQFEKNLYPDDLAAQEPCTAQSVIYTVYGTASFLANMVKRIAKGDPVPQDLLFDHMNFQILTVSSNE